MDRSGGAKLTFILLEVWVWVDVLRVEVAAGLLPLFWHGCASTKMPPGNAEKNKARIAFDAPSRRFLDCEKQGVTAWTKLSC